MARKKDYKLLWHEINTELKILITRLQKTILHCTKISNQIINGVYLYSFDTSQIKCITAQPNFSSPLQRHSCSFLLKIWIVKPRLRSSEIFNGSSTTSIHGTSHRFLAYVSLEPESSDNLQHFVPGRTHYAESADVWGDGVGAAAAEWSCFEGVLCFVNAG